MRIEIKTKNFDLTEAIRIFVEKKILAIEKLIIDFEKNTEILVRVEVGKITQHHYKGDVFRAEINLDLPNKLLRAETQAKNLNSAVVEAKKILERQIVDYKEKFKR